MDLTSWLGVRDWSTWATRSARARRRVTPRRRAAPRLEVEVLEDRYLLSATLLRDINPAGISSSPSFLTAVGDRLFFRAMTPATGEELWVTDGTAEGTRLVQDISAGPAGSVPGPLTAVGDRPFFTAFTPATGQELWVTDGTAEGTCLVQDIDPGSTSSDPSFLTAVGDRLFFAATVPGGGQELWVTDGTAEGTRLVQDIDPGTTSSSPFSLAVVGRRLFFAAMDGLHGVELWLLAPARVESIVRADDAPGSLIITFNGIVTLQPGAFLVIGEDDVPVALDITESVVDGRTVVVLTFTPPEGAYALVIRADMVRDCLGDPLDGDGGPGSDLVEVFFRLLDDGDEGDALP